jgi:hypothetical protein
LKLSSEKLSHLSDIWRDFGAFGAKGAREGKLCGHLLLSEYSKVRAIRPPKQYELVKVDYRANKCIGEKFQDADSVPYRLSLRPKPTENPIGEEPGC